MLVWKVVNFLRGLLFLCALATSSFLGVVILHWAYLPLLWTRPVLHRRLCDQIIGSWLVFSPALQEYLLGIRPVICGDEIRSGEGSLLLMNHRTRLDWLYLWQLLLRQCGVRTEKIILKSPLKFIPGAGWAMQTGAFLFLTRKWENDKLYLTTMIDYFSAISLKAQVLLFPEGTNLTKVTLDRSQAFAEKNNLKSLQYVLQPRVTGFTFLTQQMRNNGQISAVYDITVAYPYNFPVTEPELLGGNFPKEVHFHVKRYDISELPESEEGLQTWCREIWDEKEDRLAHFYKHKSFAGSTSDNADGDNNNTTGNSSSSSTPSTSITSSAYGSVQWLMILTMVCWSALVLGCIFMLFWSSVARWLAVVNCVFFTYMSYGCGGFELFQAKRCLSVLGKEKKEE